MRKEAEKLLLNNRRMRNGHQFTIPSPHEYRHQWLWDSCFHAIALRNFDTDAAEKELLSLTASQQNNGMIPHESKFFFGNYTSRITQPAFVARAAWDVFEKSKNIGFLSMIFPKLHYYHMWLEQNREIDGILKYVDSNESGEDNSIEWDDEYSVPIHRSYLRWFSTYVPYFPQKAALKSVTATCIYLDAIDCMSLIAKKLGENRLSRHYTHKKEAVSSAAIRLFMQEDRQFYSRTHNNEVIKYKTHSLFSPLFAGVLTSKEAKKLVNTSLLNKKEFWTPFPLPTVAADEPKFSAKGYWRGPTWVNMNWMIHRGLRKYRMTRVANQLLEKTEALIKKSGFREYYHPLTGEGLGAKDFAWSTLIVDMARLSQFCL